MARLSMFDLHFNFTQDLGNGIVIIFICCIMIIFAVLLDLNTGINAAKKVKEKIKSRILRRTVSKIVDYYRLLVFGVMIDVLGLCFPWYNIPYLAIMVTLGVIAVEAKSVLENYHKSKSAARDLPDMIMQIIKCADKEDASKIIEFIKKNNETKVNTDT